MSIRTLLVAGFMLAAAAAGYGLARWLGDGPMHDTAADSTCGAAESAPDRADRQVLYWVAPMDPDDRRDRPGKSPMGMDLIPVYADQVTDAQGVRIDPLVQQNLGVRIARVTRASLSRDIATVGYTAWDESTLTMLYPRAEGWLEGFGIDSVGDRLARGDVLYALFAPKLSAAQQEFLTARTSGNSGLIAAARSRLLSLGMTDTQIRALEARGRVEDRLDFRTDRDAVVTALSVRQGSFVTPQTHIATLADPARIWIDVEVLQSQAGWVEPGLPATATFSAWPGQVWRGEVAYVYPELNAATRTLRVRLQFDNPDTKLKPNMFAQVRIAAAPRNDLLQVPPEAVIRAAGGERVVTASGNGRFRVVPVRIGSSNREAVEILDGLEEGDLVVTSGQFLIDSEANGAQALERLNALREASGTASIAGFPRRGQLRLVHDPIPELGWPRMNRVFDVGPGVDLMPFSKQDRVRFTLRETLDGGWEVVAIEPLQSDTGDASAAPANAAAPR